MSDIITPNSQGCCASDKKPNVSLFGRAFDFVKSLGTPVWAGALILLGILIFVPENFGEHLFFTADSLLSIAPYLLLSIMTAAYLKASGADQLVALAFSGNPTKAIIIASMVGALSPFCSCGVIPLVAALLASGVPFAPVLAFCIASPVMDPEMFILTAATLGLDFAMIKTSAAIGMGLFAGFATMALSKMVDLNGGLKDIAAPKCGSSALAKPDVKWKIWQQDELRSLFGSEAWKSFKFLGKWLAFAFLIEGLMISYVPADNIANLLGSGNDYSIFLAALIGIPTYLNGYAAIPLVNGLMDLGMSAPTALTFMVAGAATCIPAAVGIWSLLKPTLFSLYLGFALVGSLLAGLIFQFILDIL